MSANWTGPVWKARIWTGLDKNILLFNFLCIFMSVVNHGMIDISNFYKLLFNSRPPSTFCYQTLMTVLE